jgi:hypothetical protein
MSIHQKGRDFSSCETSQRDMTTKFVANTAASSLQRNSQSNIETLKPDKHNREIDVPRPFGV